MYKILVGLSLKEHAKLNNKEQALTIFRTASQDHNMVYLTYKGKVILYQGKPKIRQQKIGKEISGPKAKRLKDISIFNLEGF